VNKVIAVELVIDGKIMPSSFAQLFKNFLTRRYEQLEVQLK